MPRDEKTYGFVVGNNFFSKLDLSRELEIVESMNTNHMQMARYCSKDKHGYRAISGVLKSFVRQELDGKGTSPARPADVFLYVQQIIKYLV